MVGQAGMHESRRGEDERRWDVYEGSVRPFAGEVLSEYVGRLLRGAGQGSGVGAVASEAKERWRAYFDLR